MLATQPVEAPGAGPDALLTGTSNLPGMLNRPVMVERLLILPVGLIVMEIYTVNWAHLLMTTSKTVPQTEMNLLIKNSLRRPAIERQSEA